MEFFHKKYENKCEKITLQINIKKRYIVSGHVKERMSFKSQKRNNKKITATHIEL